MVQQDDENKSTENEVIEELKKALEEEKARAEENLAGWKRAQADFINYKRFAEQDKAEYCKYANIGLLEAILPVVDDFERALAHVPPNEANEQWVKGMELVYRKFRDILQKQGVSQVQALGMEFDCRTMEAVTTVKGKKNIVVMEIEKGYMLQDKVIRPAKVAVGEGEGEETEEKPE